MYVHTYVQLTFMCVSVVWHRVSVTHFYVLCICVFCFLPLPFRFMFLFSFPHTAIGGDAGGIRKNKTHNCCCTFFLMYVSAETSGQLLREWNKWIRHFYLTKPSPTRRLDSLLVVDMAFRPYTRIRRQHNFCCRHICTYIYIQTKFKLCVP